MKRFHVLTIFVVAAALAAFLLQQPALCEIILILFFMAIGAGVASPRLKLFGNFICSGNQSKKQIALTFDDGPDSRSTPQLLDLLRAEKISAAFFCIGKHVEKNPEIAARILREGHLVENHSFAHSNFINFYSPKRLREELIQAQTAVEKAVGIAPKFYRPPVGLTNPGTFRVAEALGLRVIGWNVRSLDTVTADPAEIVTRIERGLKPGAIILLHDGNIPPEKLLTTVKSLLDRLRALGYQVVRLDELLK